MNEWTLKNSRDLLDAAEDTLRPGGLSLTKQALDLCDFADDSKILDAGCGTAVTTRHLTQLGKLTAFGVDRSSTLLGEARSCCQELPLLCALLENLPFTKESFDGIICECVLSQTPAAEVLAEFWRVLRPGGLLILSDLYRKTLWASKTAGLAANNDLATKEQTVDMLEDAHFKLTYWQDRTKELKRLAVSLIMAPGSRQDNLFGWSRHSCGSTEKAVDGERQDAGYHLLIARRSEK